MTLDNYRKYVHQNVIGEKREKRRRTKNKHFL